MISLPNAAACVRSFTAFLLLGPRGLCTICVPTVRRVSGAEHSNKQPCLLENGFDMLPGEQAQVLSSPSELLAAK